MSKKVLNFEVDFECLIRFLNVKNRFYFFNIIQNFILSKMLKFELKICRNLEKKDNNFNKWS